MSNAKRDPACFRVCRGYIYYLDHDLQLMLIL